MRLMFKRPYRHKLEKEFIEQIPRRQFNFSCREEYILGVKVLASILECPQYVIAEHLLQVGAEEVLKHIQDGKEELQRHLIDAHLLAIKKRR